MRRDKSGGRAVRTLGLVILSIILISVFAGTIEAQAQGADIGLGPEDITFSNDSPASGEVLNINVTIHNMGPNGATNVEVTFTVNAIPLPPSKTIAAIEPGGESKTTHQWVAPVQGEYTIGVSVSGDQNDPDESNNQASKNITVGATVPQIDVEAGASQEVIQATAPFFVNGTAEMNGEPVQNGDVTAEIVQTGAKEETTTGSEGNFSVEMTAPTDQNKYNIRVTVSQNAVSGEDTVNITVVQPDLMVTLIKFSPEVPRAGDPVDVEVGIQNVGNGTAHDVKFVLNIDDEMKKEQDFTVLSKGETKTVKYKWKAKEGSHSVQVVLDPDDNIDEIDEDNNKKAETIEVKEKKEDSPSFELILFVMAFGIIFLLMRNGNNKGPK